MRFKPEVKRRRIEMGIESLFGGGGGIFGAIFNAVSLMTPMGWAMQAAKMLMSQVGMNILQKLGEAIGLPQPLIDGIQAGFAAAIGQPGLAAENLKEMVGGLAQASNTSPTEQGRMERELNSTIDDFIQKQADGFKKGAKEGESAAERSGRGKSWLQKIADAMAKVMDAKIESMDKQALALDKQGDKKSIKASTDLQVAGQEFSYLMQTTSTVIKTLGEGLTGMARKS
jgi:hypothetical protein